MILERFFEPRLAQTSYLVGCAASGDAAVIDPIRDVEPYLKAVAAHGLRITHVTETHIHADYVSGTRELAARTGARMLLSGCGGDTWRYGFDDGATLLQDGDAWSVGRVWLEAWHTPGHTPEHLAFLLTDAAAADRPMGIFSGDCLFVGDVGRPDLLERAAGQAGTMEGAARELFRSLQRLRTLPEYLQVWPGHGAGSACGRAPGAVPQSTLGYELRFNWAFAEEREDAFVDAVLDGQPEPPAYFGRMKELNRDGPPLLGGLPQPRRLSAERAADLFDGDGLVVDTRPAEAFARAHLPGTLSIPRNGAFVTWCGWLLPYGRDLYLVVDGAGEAADRTARGVARDLSLIGFDRVAGYFDADALARWTGDGRRLARLGEIECSELARRLERGELTLVDVREPSEWRAERIPGVRNVPLGRLQERLGQLPGGSLVLHCETGARSAIGVSLLAARGRTPVLSCRGGLTEWKALGLPVERG